MLNIEDFENQVDKRGYASYFGRECEIMFRPVHSRFGTYEVDINIAPGAESYLTNRGFPRQYYDLQNALSEMKLWAREWDQIRENGHGQK